jgi:hypothetical protein
VVLALLVQAVRGRTPLALLGAYEETGRHGYSAGEVLKWLVWHVAELDLYLVVVPLAAFVVLGLSWRTLEPHERAFFAAASALTAWLLVEVAAFASLPGVTRIEERDVFYVAPFFLIALLLWIDRGLPRPRSTWVVAACAGLLVGVLVFSDLIERGPTADTLQLIPWWRLQAHGLTAHEAWLLATLAALCAGALFVFVPRRYALALPLLLFLYFSVAQRPIGNLLAHASRASLAAGIGSVPPNWIDRLAGDSGDVAAVWTGRTRAYTIWENEFFNRSVGPVYDVAPAIPGGLASTPASVGAGGFLRDGDGGTIHHRYVLADNSLHVNGVERAADTARGMTLWQVDGPIRVSP